MSILLQLGVRLEQTAVPLPNPLTASQTTVTAPIEAVDDLDRAGRRRRTLVWVGALYASLVATVILAVGLCPVGIAPETVTQIIGYHVLGFPAEPTWAAGSILFSERPDHRPARHADPGQRLRRDRPGDDRQGLSTG